MLRKWIVFVGILQHALKPLLGTCEEESQKPCPAVGEKEECVLGAAALPQGMNAVPPIFYCTHILQILIAPSRPSVKIVVGNEQDRVWEHLHEPHYTHPAQLFYAAMRHLPYTALRSLTCRRPHICERADQRKRPSCLPLIIYAFRAIFFVYNPQSVLKVTVQLLSRPVTRNVKNRRRGSGYVRLLFCNCAVGSPAGRPWLSPAQHPARSSTFPRRNTVHPARRLHPCRSW